MPGRTVFIGAFLLFLPVLGWAQDFQIRVTLEPAVIGLEETAVLAIEVEARGMGRLRVEPEFQLDNLEVVGGPYRAESFRFVNGVTSRSLTLKWEVRPLAVGMGRVHSVALRLRNQLVELPGRTVEVQAQPPPGRPSQPRPLPWAREPFEDFFGREWPPRHPRAWRRPPPPKIFLVAEIAPQRPYVGQQALYTLYLYTQTNILSVNPQRLPTFQGFWVTEIPQPETPVSELVEHEGERYGRVTLLQRALFPLRPGGYELEPVEAELVVKVPEVGPFGPLFSRTEEMHRASNGVRIEVQPLPPPPAEFTGTVGQLSLSTKLQPEVVDVGEAATLSITLEGRGSLHGVPAPSLASLPGLKVFPPQHQAEEEVAGTTVRGRRTWTFVLVPERTGRWELPGMEIPYFDPYRGEYRMATSPPLKLQVRPSVATASSASPNLELHPIRSGAVPLQSVAAWWWRWLPGLFLLPWGLLAVLTFARHRRRFQVPTPAEARFAQRLAQVPRDLRSRQAARELENAWAQYLAEGWGIDAATSPARWPEILKERGASPETVQALERLLADLHYLRYAPELSSVDALRHELVDRSRRLLVALR